MTGKRYEKQMPSQYMSVANRNADACVQSIVR